LKVTDSRDIWDAIGVDDISELRLYEPLFSFSCTSQQGEYCLLQFRKCFGTFHKMTIFIPSIWILMQDASSLSPENLKSICAASK